MHEVFPPMTFCSSAELSSPRNTNTNTRWYRDVVVDGSDAAQLARWASPGDEAFRRRRRDALICSQASQSINVAQLRPTGDKRGRTPAVRTFARNPLPCSRCRRPSTVDCDSRLAPPTAASTGKLRKTINWRHERYFVNFANPGLVVRLRRMD